MHSAFVGLADRRPLLIAVDDLEACDPESLALLAFVARRIEGSAIALVLTATARSRGGEADPVAAVAGAPGLETLVLTDLSAEGTAALLGARIGSAPDEAFTAVVQRATGGNPSLVVAVADAVAAEGIAPTADSAARASELAPAGISRSVLAGLEPDARAVARAAAVLGSDCELADVAALAGLTPAAAGAAADELVARGVLLPDSPIGFARPIVRASVYADLLPHERAAAHARAARLMADRGRAHRVVAHLLASEPTGDDWLVEQLEQAAAVAMRDASPQLAWRLLVRALAEPPAPPDRPRLLLAAGVASARSDGADAATLLSEALELEGDPGLRAAAIGELAQNLAYSGRAGRAARLLLEGIDELGGEEALRTDLEALLMAFAATATSARRIAGDRLGSASAARSRDPKVRRLLASLALEQATGGGTAPVAITLAQRALSGGILLSEQRPGSPLPHLATAALLVGRPRRPGGGGSDGSAGERPGGGVHGRRDARADDTRAGALQARRSLRRRGRRDGGDGPRGAAGRAGVHRAGRGDERSGADRAG